MQLLGVGAWQPTPGSWWTSPQPSTQLSAVNAVYFCCGVGTWEPGEYGQRRRTQQPCRASQSAFCTNDLGVIGDEPQ
jgi:hypothetical protein